MNFFTIANHKYFPQALCLIESIRKFYRNSKIFLINTDDFLDKEVFFYKKKYNFEVINIKKIQIKDLSILKKKYNITEISTSIKPDVFKFLFKKNLDKVIYFDPDIILLDRLEELEKNKSEIILTPHITKPYNDKYKPDEKNILGAGIYNLGFLFLKKTNNTTSFLNFWSSKLYNGGYNWTANTMFTDQLWVNFSTLFYDNTFVIKDPGYNLAYWNLHHGKVKREKNKWLINNYPIKFFHFSGYSFNKFSQHQNRYDFSNIGELNDLCKTYKKMLKNNGFFYFNFFNSYFYLDDNKTKIDSSINKWFWYAIDKDIKIPKKITKSFFLQNDNSIKNNSFVSRYEHGYLLNKFNANITKDLENKYNQKSYKKIAYYDYENFKKNTKIKTIFNIIIYIFFLKLAMKFIDNKSLINFLKEKLNPKFYNFFKSLYLSIYPDFNKNTSYFNFNKSSINLIGYSRGNFGVAENLKRLFSCINKKKYQLKIIPTFTNGYHEENDTSLIAFENNNLFFRNFNSINILCVNADQTVKVIRSKFLKMSFNIGYWFWELEKFPQAWREAEKSVDVLWAPSHYVYENLINYTKKKVQYMPVTINVKINKKFNKKYFNFNNNFIFFYNFDFDSFIERKNPAGLIKAFKIAFTKNLNVQLVLKVSNQNKFYNNYLKIKSQIKDYKNIIIIDNFYSRDEMNGLLNSIDVYCSLHRSEGFGLGLAESMFLGKPCIATNYSGNLTFMNSENSLLVDCKLIKVKKEQYPHYENQVWADPNISQAARYMKLLYYNKKKYNELSVRAKNFMKKHHSVSASKKFFDKNIEEL
jgi:hypothetical protein